MEKEKNIIANFYTAFSQLNAEDMVKYYHPEVIFEDPAFGVLKGARAGNMWRMLLSKVTKDNFKVTFSEVNVKGDTGEANWEAFYPFSKTGRKVHNKVHASFLIKDGLIIKHIDNFSMHSWARQALGMKGFFLGWTSFFKKEIQTQTNKTLDLYIKRNRL